MDDVVYSITMYRPVRLRHNLIAEYITKCVSVQIIYFLSMYYKYCNCNGGNWIGGYKWRGEDGEGGGGGGMAGFWGGRPGPELEPMVVMPIVIFDTAAEPGSTCWDEDLPLWPRWEKWEIRASGEASRVEPRPFDIAVSPHFNLFIPPVNTRRLMT